MSIQSQTVWARKAMIGETVTDADGKRTSGAPGDIIMIDNNNTLQILSADAFAARYQGPPMKSDYQGYTPSNTGAESQAA